MRLSVIEGENTTPSCVIDGIAEVNVMVVVDDMSVILAILAIGSVKLAVIVHGLVLLDGCSPFLLFLD